MSIYKIYCKDSSIKDFYVGCTFRYDKRKSDHKGNVINKNTKLYKFIRENGGWDNWIMVEIEKTGLRLHNPVGNNYFERYLESGQKLRNYENYWIFELNPSLNTVIPHNSIKNNTNRLYITDSCRSIINNIVYNL